MLEIKRIVREDKKLNDELKKANCSFDFMWTLMKPEEMRSLIHIINDNERVAAFFKKIMFAMLRAFNCGLTEKKNIDRKSKGEKNDKKEI